MGVGENITIIRKRLRGWTQGDLASRIGLSTRTLSYYERGQRSPRAEALRAIAAAMDVPVVVLHEADPREALWRAREAQGDGGTLREIPSEIEITRPKDGGGAERVRASIPSLDAWHPGLRELWIDRSDWEQRDITADDILRVAAVDLRAQSYQPLDREGAISWCHWVRTLYERDLRSMRRHG